MFPWFYHTNLILACVHCEDCPLLTGCNQCEDGYILNADGTCQSCPNVDDASTCQSCSSSTRGRLFLIDECLCEFML